MNPETQLKQQLEEHEQDIQRWVDEIKTSKRTELKSKYEILRKNKEIEKMKRKIQEDYESNKNINIEKRTKSLIIPIDNVFAEQTRKESLKEVEVQKGILQNLEERSKVASETIKKNEKKIRDAEEQIEQIKNQLEFIRNQKERKKLEDQLQLEQNIQNRWQRIQNPQREEQKNDIEEDKRNEQEEAKIAPINIQQLQQQQADNLIERNIQINEIQEIAKNWRSLIATSEQERRILGNQYYQQNARGTILNQNREIFSETFRLFPFLLFIYNINDYTRNGFQGQHLVNDNRIYTDFVIEQFRKYQQDIGDEEVKIIMSQVFHNLLRYPIPLFMLNAILKQVTMYQYQQQQLDQLNFPGFNQRIRCLTYIQRFPVEISHFKIDAIEDTQEIDYFIDQQMERFYRIVIKGEPIPQIFVTMRFSIVRIYRIDGEENRQIINIVRSFPLELREYQKRSDTVHGQLKRFLQLEIENWYRDSAQDNLDWDFNSVALNELRFTLIHRAYGKPAQKNWGSGINRLVIDDNKQLQKYYDNNVRWSNEPQWFAHCKRWDKTFENLLLHKEVLQPGLCLFESWFWCTQQSDENSKFNESQLMNFFNTQFDDQLQRMFIKGDVNEMVHIFGYTQFFQGVGVYIFHSAHWVYPETYLEQQKVTKLIIVKDGHAFPIRYNNNEIAQAIRSKQKMFANKDLQSAKIEQITQKGLVIKKNTKKEQKERKQKNEKKKNEVLIWFFDLETYSPEKDGKQSAYLGCMICPMMNIRLSFRGLDCVDQFNIQIRQMLSDGRKHEIWSFNGAKFDYLFLLGNLINSFNVTLTGSHQNIKQIIIGDHDIVFLDFRNFFPFGSLREQAKEWKLDVQKGDFDYSKVNNENLFDIMDESEAYCFKDCEVLAQLYEKFIETLSSITKRNFFSATQLSFYIWKSQYTHEEVVGLDRKHYQCFRDGYRGGLTMHLKKSNGGKKLYYMDVNSMYPYIMTREMPCKMVNHQQQYMEITKAEIGEIKQNTFYQMSYFKFYDTCQIPYIAVRDKKSNLNYYVSENNRICYAWGEELLFGLENDQIEKVKIQQSWEFDTSFLFKEYILDSYAKRKVFKEEGNKAGADAEKLKMNSLYGKFGTKIFNTKEYVTFNGLQERVFKNQKENWIRNITQLNDNVNMIEYFDDEYQISSCVYVSSYITAAARIHLLKKVLKCGAENVYYMDTDSIVSSVLLDSDEIGDELGQMKLEYEIKEAIFLGAKVYYFETMDGKEHFHMKGVNKNYFKHAGKKVFEDLRDNQQVEIQNKNVFKRKIGEMMVKDELKKISEIKKRRFFNDQFSMPFKSIEDACLANLNKL